MLAICTVYAIVYTSNLETWSIFEILLLASLFERHNVNKMVLTSERH